MLAGSINEMTSAGTFSDPPLAQLISLPYAGRLLLTSGVMVAL